MLSWIARGLRVAAVAAIAGLALGGVTGKALAAACNFTGTGMIDKAASLGVGDTLTFSSSTGYVRYAYLKGGGMYNYIFAPSPATVTITTAGTYSVVLIGVDAGNSVNYSASLTLTCVSAATTTQTSGNTIASNAAQSTQYVAPKVMSTATTAIGTLIGTNVRGAFSRVGSGIQGRSTGTALAGDVAPEIVLADASRDMPRVNAGASGLKQGLLGGKLGGFAEMSYSHLRSREAGGEYVGDVKNGVAGLDYKLRDDLLIGIAAGYEFSDFTTIYNSGWLDGEGLTIAPYFGYAFDNFVLDITLGRSWLNYDVMRGTGGPAYGSYDATREFITSNLTATYGWRGLRLAPTAGLLFARETAEAYIDSTGVRQDEVTSKMGRVSLGGEIGRPLDVGDLCVCSFEPFIKAKLNYDFLHDGRVVLANGQLSAVNDVTAQLGGGFRIGLYRYLVAVIDGSYDTLGATDLEGWNVRGRVDFTLPF